MASDTDLQNPDRAFEHFPLGARVRDTKQDANEDATAYVVGHAAQWDDEYEIARDGTTVADVNPPQSWRYPVIEVVFEDTLASYFPDWDEHAGSTSLPWALAEHKAEWDVDVNRYAYPAWRLERLDNDD